MTFTQTKTRSFLPIILLFFGVFIFFIFIFFRILVDDLPSVEKLTEIKLSVPLKIYTSDKKLIAELELSAAVGTLSPKNLGLNYNYDDLNRLPRPKNPLDSD